MDNYSPIEDFRFTHLHFKGNFGTNGQFILQPSLEHRLATLTFSKSYLWAQLEIEALDVKLVIFHSRMGGNMRIQQNGDTLTKMTNENGWLVWKQQPTSYQGMKRSTGRFFWYPENTPKVASLITSSHSKSATGYLFNFMIKDEQPNRGELLILLGVAFIQLATPNFWIQGLSGFSQAP
ncbi:MAG: hypothetical protein AAFV80_21290 [Bacteroidota bacterium]